MGSLSDRPSRQKGENVNLHVTEFTVEEAALAGQGLGHVVKNGAEIAPGEPYAQREDYGEVVLKQGVRDALVRRNPDLPAEALDDALRKVIRPEGPTLEGRDRSILRDALLPKLIFGEIRM